MDGWMDGWFVTYDYVPYDDCLCDFLLVGICRHFLAFALALLFFGPCVLLVVLLARHLGRLVGFSDMKFDVPTFV
jgi:hypothetical protein